MSAPSLTILVEHEAMIVDMLEALGHRIAGKRVALPKLWNWRKTPSTTLPILDVNLRGALVTPAAEVIQRRGVPIIFATGYGSVGLPEKFRDRPVLQKPFQIDALARFLKQLPSGA